MVNEIKGEFIMSTTAITNVRVFDGENLTEPKTVVIENGLISGKTIGDTIVDGSGCTLLPGLIDSHIHLDNIDNLKEAAKYGVTTMLDMTTASSELVDSLRNKPSVTDIRSCYLAASAPDSILIKEMGYPEDTVVTSIKDAERFVNEQVALGADYIKVILEDPAMSKSVLSLEIITALVEASHKKDKLVFAHTTTPSTYKTALDAGVDVLNHIPMVAILPKSIIDEVVAKGVYIIPTMVMERGITENMKKINPKAPLDFHNVEVSMENLIKAGAKIIAGTDANRTNKMSYIAHGSSIHEELELMVKAGFTPVDALKSATSVPSKVFGFSDRGVIKEGCRADLLLVEGNPTENIRATRNIKNVWIAGIKLDNLI